MLKFVLTTLSACNSLLMLIFPVILWNKRFLVFSRYIMKRRIVTWLTSTWKHNKHFIWSKKWLSCTLKILPRAFTQFRLTLTGEFRWLFRPSRKQQKPNPKNYLQMKINTKSNQVSLLDVMKIGLRSTIQYWYLACNVWLPIQIYK